METEQSESLETTNLYGKVVLETTILYGKGGALYGKPEEKLAR